MSDSYGTDLDSLEINLRRPFGCAANVLAGFRWIGLDENLIGRNVNGAFNHVCTENDLFGFQIGVDALLLKHCGGRLEWRGSLKAGAYYNRTGHSTVAPRIATGKGDDVAFCGELWLGGICRMARRLSVRAGYQLAWISGVALAAEQPKTWVFGPPAAVQLDVDADGDLFLHGDFVGVEYRR